MKEYDDKDFEKIEKRIKEQFDTIEIQSEEEFLAAIRPKLKKKRKRSGFKSPFMTKAVAVAASILLLFGIGLTVWLLWPNPDILPEYRYEDGVNIEKKTCVKSDLTDPQGLYVPDLEIFIDNELFYTAYWVGEHKESYEKVYFTIEGTNIDNGIMRQISLRIILQKKYSIDNENDYNSDDKITVNPEKLTEPVEISYLEIDSVEPFNNYKIGFKIGDVRYYMDYQTTSPENDIESFMQLFLK